MSQALARQQSLLLEAVFGTGGMNDDLLAELQTPTANRGMQAYRANGHALAERALTAAFPVVAQMMGDESFAPLARFFWCRHPPQRGDMAQWGGELPDFLDAAPQLVNAPYFGDIARIEWALHCAAIVSDTVLDTASFAWLGQSEGVSLRLGPSVFLLASAYPVVSLVNAHRNGHDSASPSLAEAFNKLESGAGERALVWRQGFKPFLRQLGAAEHALLRALQSGQPLEQALNHALNHASNHVLNQAFKAPDNESFTHHATPAFDFNAWLTHSVHQGLVTGAKRRDD